jgi:hypothetical protein
MTAAGITRAKEFSIRRAASTLIEVFTKGLADYRKDISM